MYEKAFKERDYHNWHAEVAQGSLMSARTSKHWLNTT